ncbi:hypothetical protein BG015_007822 [Linnemannia schmuckeri]|uniref:Uncharacterized protein n=1 Tax=Linnemannia schmuckeri TaxID=64567 RepID=A0A9P5S0M5_9FUNG|nr:hypothetical protein BG015_007822 [Linnemannia schmuckeri]
MPFIRFDTGATPTGFGDDDPTVGMGFNSGSNATRGPIALSDDDLEGATRIDWDELDAQFENLSDNGSGEELVAAGGGGRLLKPMTRQTRYLDDDDEDNSQDEEPYRMNTGAGDEENDAPFVDDDEELEAEVAVPGKSVKKDRLFTLDAEEGEHEN